MTSTGQFPVPAVRVGSGLFIPAVVLSDLESVTTRMFLSVGQVADLTRVPGLRGLSATSIYRAISNRQFPAVRVGRRWLIRVAVLSDMAEAALSTNQVVDASDWVDGSQAQIDLLTAAGGSR
jgi:predicted DNA-binding transcriptional regulator AlpA